ncbi:hypothetical protein BDD12DRAFT_873513 [Trichophaea hybrida]|nr:hypothetical protein BDD12DRAFT_873513 [Trichophaea hybrida]
MRGKRLKDDALPNAHSTASGSRDPLQARTHITAVSPSTPTTTPAATVLHAFTKPTRGSLTISESKENRHRNDRNGYQAPYEMDIIMLLYNTYSNSDASRHPRTTTPEIDLSKNTVIDSVFSTVPSDGRPRPSVQDFSRTDGRRQGRPSPSFLKTDGMSAVIHRHRAVTVLFRLNPIKSDNVIQASECMKSWVQRA